jgi:hypothetical protein
MKVILFSIIDTAGNTAYVNTTGEKRAVLQRFDTLVRTRNFENCTLAKDLQQIVENNNDLTAGDIVITEIEMLEQGQSKRPKLAAIAELQSNGLSVLNAPKTSTYEYECNYTPLEAA